MVKRKQKHDHKANPMANKTTTWFVTDLVEFNKIKATEKTTVAELLHDMIEVYKKATKRRKTA